MRPVGDPACAAQIADRFLDMRISVCPLRHHSVIDRVVDVLDERRAVLGLLAVWDGLVNLGYRLGDMILGGEPDPRGDKCCQRETNRSA
jgi:hypothetical protein